jgi:hypothetical protein
MSLRIIASSRMLLGADGVAQSARWPFAMPRYYAEMAGPSCADLPGIPRFRPAAVRATIIAKNKQKLIGGNRHDQSPHICRAPRRHGRSPQACVE